MAKTRAKCAAEPPPAESVPTPGYDSILEDEEDSYVDEPKEESRASDLYLDTVNSPLNDLACFLKLIFGTLDK